MKLFQKMFNKNHELNEEEQQRFNSMVDKNSSSSQGSSQMQQSPYHFVASLQSLEEINKIRNLLDSRQKELETGSMYLVDSDIKHQEEPEFEEISVQSHSISEENISKPISEDELNNQTYEEQSSSDNKNEVSRTYEEQSSSNEYNENQLDEPSSDYSDNLNSYEEKNLSSDSPDLTFGNEEETILEIPQEENYQFLDKEEEINPMPQEILHKEEKINTNKGIEIDLEPEQEDRDFVDFESINSDKPTEVEKTSSQFTPTMDLYLESIKSVFGNENILSRIEEEAKTPYNSNKKLLHIGIRQKEYFGQGDTLEENAWFIGHIKQLPDLKSYKMLRSEQGMKDLVKEEDSHITIISFRATTFLNSIDNFDFEL